MAYYTNNFGSSTTYNPYLQYVTAVNYNENPVNQFTAASEKASRESKIIGGKIGDCQNLIKAIENNQRLSGYLLSQLKDFVTPETFDQICSVVSEAIIGTENVKEGKLLLESNVSYLLCLKNKEGINILDHLINHFKQELEVCHAIIETNELAALLAQGNVKNALAKFEILSPKAKYILCELIWQLDNQDGYNTIKDDVAKVYGYKNTCPVKDCLSKLHKEALASFTFESSCSIGSPNIVHENPRMGMEIFKLEQLRAFKDHLTNPHNDHHFLAGQYNMLHPELKLLLSNIACIASFQPDQSEKGDQLLKDNPRWLLQTQNENGLDILDQLISHHTAKVKAIRLVSDLNRYLQHFDFDKLEEETKDAIRFQVWYQDGGKDNPHFGWLTYGQDTIQSNPTRIQPIVRLLIYEISKESEPCDEKLINDFKQAKSLGSGPVDVSTRPLENQKGLIKHIPENMQVAFVTAEYKGVASVGGLGTAMQGMVQGFGVKDAKVIIPLYKNGPIPKQLYKEALSNEKTGKYKIESRGGIQVRIFKAKVNGVSVYFVDADCFWIPPKHDGTVGNMYEGNYNDTRARFAIFQSAAADLIYQFNKKKPTIAHSQDAQSALVPKILKERHLEEWMRGETPATVFTFHNNLEPMLYSRDNNLCHDLRYKIGMNTSTLNSFVEALQDADMNTTVSSTFGKEAQMSSPDFGRGLHEGVKKAALKGKLFGIVNGNSIGFDPSTDKQLKEWKPTQLSNKVDLSFNSDMDNQTLVEQIRKNQYAFCDYLRNLGPTNPCYANLDPEKPIIAYMGRFDSSQKGIDKLEMIMKEVIAQGGQFIAIGVEPDDKAKDMLAEMQKYAKARNNEGVLILIDEKENGQLVHQSKFGKLFRAAVTMGVFPSRYEPCGLVQGEFNLFGKKAIATRTGGFADTLDESNGYLFQRCDNWESEGQNAQIKITLTQALNDAKAMQQALYHGSQEEVARYMEQTKAIMKRAKASTWDSSPDGSLSPVQKLELVYAKALQQRSLRSGGGHVSLNTLTI